MWPRLLDAVRVVALSVVILPAVAVAGAVALGYTLASGADHLRAESRRPRRRP